jgi:hypothetical protein
MLTCTPHDNYIGTHLPHSHRRLTYFNLYLFLPFLVVCLEIRWAQPRRQKSCKAVRRPTKELLDVLVVDESKACSGGDDPESGCEEEGLGDRGFKNVEYGLGSLFAEDVGEGVVGD